MRLELRPFRDEDIARLVRWAGDERFVMQWGGPTLCHPLDAGQVRRMLEQIATQHPPGLALTALEAARQRPVGHVELLHLDRANALCMLCRVLIGPPELRGRGLGTQMVARAVELAFGPLAMREVRLGVFDFNYAALDCYHKVGFRPYDCQPGFRQFGKESWTLILMNLRREEWAGLPALTQPAVS